MTRQSATNLRKLNGHLVHLALEIEQKVNNARKNHFEELIQLHRMTGKKPAD